MNEIVQAITETPIPTILVLAGVLFLLMSVADRVSAHLTIPESRKKQAMLLGLMMLAGGVALNVLPGVSGPGAELANVPAAQEAPEAPAVALASVPEAVDWQAMSWAMMDDAQKAHWSTLGWSADVWENGPAPATDGKDFAALSADVKAAAIGLGFTQASWDDPS